MSRILWIFLVLLALGVRGLQYDRVLPALDYSDESNMFLLSVDMRGDEVPLANDYGAYIQGEWLAGYPPLYPWIGVWSQRFTEQFTNFFLFPGDYIHTLRIVSVMAGALTVLLLAWFGWTLAAPFGRVGQLLAALLAGSVWAIAPQIVEIGNLAIPDSLIYPACALALLGGARAITEDAPLWLVGALLGAVAAIYLKYSSVFALWPVAYGVWVLVRRRGLRSMLGWLAVLAAISAATAGYLLWGYGALDLQNQEAEGFRETGIANMLSLGRNAHNLLVALDVSVGVWLFTGTLVAGAAAYWISRQRGEPVIDTRWLWLLVPYVIGNTLLTSSVVLSSLEAGGYGRVRYMFPAALVVVIVWALCITQIHSALRRASQASLAMSAVFLLMAGFMVPAFVANAAQIRHFTAPDARYLLWRWADESLPPDGKFLIARESRLHTTFNRPYSGYSGSKGFEWVHDENPARGTPQDAFAADIHYFALDEQDLQTVYNTAAMRTFIDSLMPLKTFPADDLVGHTTHVYRTVPPQNEVNVVFDGQIALSGYDLSADVLAAGDVLVFRPYWRAARTPDAQYSMFLHFYPAGDPSAIQTQHDGPPALRPTYTWDDPEERLIGTEVTLVLPDDLPPGDYQLGVGIYDFNTGARLLLETGADRYNLPITLR